MDLNSLFEEKKVIEEKLEKLEGMKAGIKEIVYNKIKEEYIQKLKEIDNEIKNNTESIKQEIDNIHAEIGNLNKVIEDYDIQLQEIEVKIQLGDLNEQDYKDRIEQLKSEIEQSKHRIDELNDKLKEYEKLTESKDDNIEIPSSSVEEVEINDNIQKDEEKTPIDNILTPSLDNDEELDMAKAFEKTLDEMQFEENKNINDEGIENIESDIGEFADNSEQREIQGLKCPKCGHINSPELFNCEKCGSELFD